MFLDIKERTIPSKIIVLEALNRRASNETITNLHKRAVIGFEGEQKVDLLWGELQLPSKALLFHSYEVVNDHGNTHQMDTLFICPHFILILEIKNVSGYIWYEEEKHQFLRRKRTGEVESFQSPIEKVNRHAEMMERIVERLGLKIPIHKAVVSAEPSTVIGKVPEETPIFHAIGLRPEMKKLLLKYSKRSLSDVHFDMLVERVIGLYNPTVYKPRFDIPPIKKGALCLCGRVMSYNRGKFICKCGRNSKEALMQGLHDYRILISEWITNKEFREFFFIESDDLVNKLLKRLNFYCEGSTKSRRHFIPKDVWRNYYQIWRNSQTQLQKRSSN